MRVTIEGLRRWILIAATLLLAAVAGFFIYGRSRLRHIERDLPARLGVNIQQSSKEITFSQTSQGHTLFTLKASKMVQLRAGHALLHDVDITLYGPPGSGREDRIYGSDFDYNQNEGIATSQGDVEIELQGVGRHSSGTGSDSGDTIRVKTTGLTFAQKSGEASTAGKVEFQLPRAAGSAVGADYNSKTGVVILNSDVHITTSANGKPATVDAGHATILRDSQQALLVNASLEYDTASGRADQATVFFRKDGTADKVDAQGHVQLHSDSGTEVDAQTSEIQFNPKSQPLEATIGGGVQFTSSRPSQTMRGSSQQGTLLFATGGPGSPTSLRHAEFRGGVRFDEQATGRESDARGRVERQVEARTLNVDFAREAGGHGVEARKAIADGSPVVTMKQMPARGRGHSMRISGDHLVATLASGNQLRTLDGTGNTQVLDELSDGAKDTTHGDVLHATFAEGPATVESKRSAVQSKRSANTERQGSGHGKKAAAPRVRTTLETAVQDGHVVLTETPARKPGESGPPATLTGWAQHAEYHAQDQVLQMTGSPRLVQGEAMQLSAEQIEYHRDTQNAAASGDVKVTYAQSAADRKAPPTMGGSGPVHVIADRAELDHASNRTTFYGTPRAPARMWQDADSLLAPAIAIDRGKNVLKAWGEGTGTAPVVDVNFAAGSPGGKRPAAATEVHSRTLVYSDSDRIADFDGNVTAEQGDAAIHADEARVYLKAKAGAEKPAAKGRAEGRGSQLDHLVATGHVNITQPGRRFDGEKLVYTADEGKYVLTGTPAAPPRLSDRERGTTTGEALIFSTQSDKVQVVGGKSSVVTETHVRR